MRLPKLDVKPKEKKYPIFPEMAMAAKLPWEPSVLDGKPQPMP